VIELEFRNVDFCGGRKTLKARERINNKLNIELEYIDPFTLELLSFVKLGV
jgi:hypothetical protein